MVYFNRKNCLTNLCCFCFLEHRVSLISQSMLLKLRRKTFVFLRMLREIRVQKKICLHRKRGFLNHAKNAQPMTIIYNCFTQKNTGISKTNVISTCQPSINLARADAFDRLTEERNQLLKAQNTIIINPLATCF